MSDSLKYWQDLAVANRKVAEDNQADAARYRRVREFLQRGNGFLDTRGMDDVGFDRMIDSLKEYVDACNECAAEIRKMKVEK